MGANTTAATEGLCRVTDWDGGPTWIVGSSSDLTVPTTNDPLFRITPAGSKAASDAAFSPKSATRMFARSSVAVEPASVTASPLPDSASLPPCDSPLSSRTDPASHGRSGKTQRMQSNFPKPAVRLFIGDEAC